MSEPTPGTGHFTMGEIHAMVKTIDGKRPTITLTLDEVRILTSILEQLVEFRPVEELTAADAAILEALHVRLVDAA